MPHHASLTHQENHNKLSAVNHKHFRKLITYPKK
jgi:hypothetical protein